MKTSEEKIALKGIIIITVCQVLVMLLFYVINI